MEFNCTHIVIGEIQNVVAAMRLNSRWSAGSPSAHMLVVMIEIVSRSSLTIINKGK